MSKKKTIKMYRKYKTKKTKKTKKIKHKMYGGNPLFDINSNLIHLQHERIETVPDLSNFVNLRILVVNSSRVTKIINLPNGLETFDCNYNKLKTLPQLPNTLIRLICDNNELEELPQLPPNLIILSCSFNKLKKLPPIPHDLTWLVCSKNNIIYLPPLPRTLTTLMFDINPIFSAIFKHMPEIEHKIIYDANEIEQLNRINDQIIKQLNEPQIIDAYNPTNLLKYQITQASKALDIAIPSMQNMNRDQLQAHVDYLMELYKQRNLDMDDFEHFYDDWLNNADKNIVHVG